MSQILTPSGKLLNLNNITADDINLEDIAHGLSKICRYGSALPLNVHYSVAQHSVLMAKYTVEEYNEPTVAKMALMHDASEAYLGDIPSGLKSCMPEYLEIERKVQNLILEKYDLWSFEAYVKQIDQSIVLDEAKTFFPDKKILFEDNLSGIKPLGITPVNEYGKERVTYYLFLWWCDKLGIKD